MGVKFSAQYEILQKILNGTIELYNVNDLNKLKLTPFQRKTVKFIIEKNKKGYAPFIDDIDNSGIYRGSYRALKTLTKKRLIVGPSCMEYASLLMIEIKKARPIFGPCPKNLIDYLMEENRGTLSWRKKLSPYHMSGRFYKKSFLALFHDENGPVYKNCFKGRELSFVPKTIPVKLSFINTKFSI